MLFDTFRSLKNEDTVSVSDGNTAITFKDSWKYSEAFAYFLRENGIKGPVILFGDKENLIIPAMYGCIKAHVIYVAIPSYYPEDRIEGIASDSGASFVFDFSDAAFPMSEIPSLGAREIEALPLKYTDMPDFPYEEHEPDDDVLYLYTSGSTGKAKGVRISYRNTQYLSRYTKDYQIENEFRRGDKILNLISYAFSASLATIYAGNLVGGCCIHTVSKKVLSDRAELFKRFFEVDPNWFIATPSLLQMLLANPDFNEEKLRDLVFICVGGEAFSIELAKRVLERFPNVCLEVGYGATETASGCLQCRLTREYLDNIEGKFAPIGYPEDKNFAFIMDDDGNIIDEDDALGELVLCGTCVSNGYLGNEEQTREKFIELDQLPGIRCFKTSDMVKRRNGYFYYVGRRDNQVKIGSNRIEIEDVEANLKTIPEVRECAVSVKRLDMNMLIAYIVPSDEGAKLSNLGFILKIKNEMKNKVPSYMIPTKIIRVEALPKNINSKLDRKKLYEMAQEA